MGKFGHLVFSALLACIYLALLTPLARLTHAGSDVPAVRWEDGAGRICGWQPKRTRTLVQGGANGRGLTATLVQVLQHFARRGQWFLLPLLILLLSLGVLLFFAQTSVIAPFIYTLF